MAADEPTTEVVRLTEAEREVILRAHVHISPRDLLAAAERIKADAYAAGVVSNYAPGTYAEGYRDGVAGEQVAALVAALSAFPDCTGCFDPGHPCGDSVCAARDRVRDALTTSEEVDRG